MSDEFDWTCFGCGKDLRDEGVHIIHQTILYVFWEDGEVDTMEAHHADQPPPRNVCAACGHEITLEQDYELANLV